MLGFAEKVEPITLLRHHFPSKIGGRPVSAGMPALMPGQHCHHPAMQLTAHPADSGMAGPSAFANPGAAHMSDNWTAAELPAAGAL